MSTYTDCIELNDYDNDPCGVREMSRVRHLIYVNKSASVSDPSDSAAWAALEASGDAKIIRNINGTYDGGAPVEGAGFGEAISEQYGIVHSLVYQDPRAVQNIDFYNNLKKVAQNYKLFFATETKIWKVDATLYASPKAPITNDLSQIVSIETTLKWSYKDLPVTFDRPVGLFEEIV